MTAQASSVPSRTRSPHSRAASSARHRRTNPAAPGDDLFSPRAKRRIAGYLRMRMLEMREEGLARAVRVIEGRSPLSSLFEEDAAPVP